MPNRLQRETSPYLLQHADNPVDWYPWCPEALAAARRADKPILLSIGYSACHWCHVMAHESFEDDTTATLMNEYFINIKVDREERPDLDKIYQTAHHLLTHNQGGWPLTMFLTPDDHIPFYAGTYFPNAPRQGLPGFNDVLTRVATAYREQTDRIAKYKEEMVGALGQVLGSSAGGDGAVTLEAVVNACEQLAESFDSEFGGFGGAPKFPHASGIELLLCEHQRSATDDPERASSLLRMAMQTLDGMAAGGIYDHLGGGFCRYSVDRSWTIPHFEKMLYDNGPLLGLYAKAWGLRHDPALAAVVTETAGWVLREMQGEHGGFYSSLDADSEGEEGRYYVWTPEAVETLLGAERFPLFAHRFGLDRPANFEGRWHLRVCTAVDELAAHSRKDAQTIRNELGAARQVLFQAREKRVRPGLDDKVLTSWNAMMIKGLTLAGLTLGRDDYVGAACSALAFLRTTHWHNGRLLATSKDRHAHLNAYLDDYAFLLDAVLCLLSARWNREHLEFAIALAEVLLDQFEDADGGGFYFTSADHESLIQRSKSFTDESYASGCGVATLALLRLGYLVGDARYLGAAERALVAAQAGVARWPSAHGALLLGAMEFAEPQRLIILRVDADSDAAAWSELAHAATLVSGSYYVIPSDATDLPALLQQKRPLAPITAYVCRARICSEPATDVYAFERLLAG